MAFCGHGRREAEAYSFDYSVSWNMRATVEVFAFINVQPPPSFFRGDHSFFWPS